LGDQPDKLGPGALLPASDARANRPLAVFKQFSHDVSNLPYVTGAGGPGPADAAEARQSARIPDV